MNLNKLTDNARKNARLNDKVKFVKSGKNIKYGNIVELTDAGAKIYNTVNRFNNKNGEDYDVSPQTAEWFPFASKTDGQLDGGIVLLSDLHQL